MGLTLKSARSSGSDWRLGSWHVAGTPGRVGRLLRGLAQSSRSVKPHETAIFKVLPPRHSLVRVIRVWIRSTNSIPSEPSCSARLRANRPGPKRPGPKRAGLTASSMSGCSSTHSFSAANGCESASRSGCWPSIFPGRRSATHSLMIAKVRRALEAIGCEPSGLEFGITEIAAMARSGEEQQNLELLRDLGSVWSLMTSGPATRRCHNCRTCPSMCSRSIVHLSRQSARNGETPWSRPFSLWPIRSSWT